jgi:broad specificity phosphatase PhoE
MTRLRRLILVRHGETEGESSIRYHGINDVALSPFGCEQMRRVAAALADTKLDAIYTSSLQRTVAAARIIAPTIPAATICGFNEINFGEWEGLTSAEIEARDPQTYREWIASRLDFVYPGGDSISGFRGRVVAAFEELLPSMPERSLVVGHKGVIKAIAGLLLGLSPEERSSLPVDLASIHILRADGTGWHAEVANRTDHLIQ